eukprot:gene27537-34269_t
MASSSTKVIRDVVPEVEGVDNRSFEDLGIIESLCQAIRGIGWTAPTDIQRGAIPEALNGRDIIGLAETGSGKTGFNLRNLKYLVMDEADRMLSMDFEEEINQILAVIPRERRTFLFSATMTSKVAKLQKASLTDPVKVEVSNKFQTPKTLVQQYLFIPAKWKDCYLAYLLDEFKGQTTIIFVATCNNALRVTLLLRNLGFRAVCLHGQLSQAKRLGALNKFKAGQRNILVATDVASRGLDIPNVDMVLNFDIPSHGKDYIHRVGRTARAGKAGRSVAFVTQYDVEAYQRLEALISQKLPEFPADEETVLILLERVNEAQRLAVKELREMQAQDPKNKKRKKGGNHEDGDDEGGGGGG